MRKIIHKKGDINLSFGVIFSVILIAVFIFSAVYGINFFLKTSKKVQIRSFYSDFQDKIKDYQFSSITTNQPFKIRLPSNIDKICFVNMSQGITRGGLEYDDMLINIYDSHNVFLYPSENTFGLSSYEIKGINLEKTLERGNPFCVDIDSGLILNKGLYENKVTIGEGVRE